MRINFCIPVMALICLGGLALSAPKTAEAGLASHTYLVPVVARNPGAAGADWRTELCLTNFQNDTLTVTIALIQGGLAGGGSIALGRGQTLCGEDFLADWFGATKWQGGMVISADEDLNPELVSRQFFVSVRVYNLTANGTFGLSVAPEPLIDEYVNVGDFLDANFITGLHHWGTAGVDGSRSSVGVTNYRSTPTYVQLVVADDSGAVVWEKSVDVEAFSQMQFGLPKSLTVASGYAGVSARDASTSIQAYATVTDNKTGDGRYLSGTLLWEPWMKVGETDATKFGSLLDLVTRRPSFQ